MTFYCEDAARPLPRRPSTPGKTAHSAPARRSPFALVFLLIDCWISM